MDRKQTGEIYLNEAGQLQGTMDDFLKQLQRGKFKVDANQWAKIHAINLEFVARALVWSSSVMHADVSEAARKVYSMTANTDQLVRSLKGDK